MLARIWSNRNSSLMRKKNDVVIWNTVLWLLTKFNTFLPVPAIVLLGISQSCLKHGHMKKKKKTTCIAIFIVTLFMIAKLGSNQDVLQ